MTSQRISAFFPAYNESDNLPGLIADADAVLSKNFSDYEIIIINDGSKDNSAFVLAKLLHKYPKLRIITHKTNLGYGAAVKSGLLTAQNDLVFFSDADRQFDLREITKLNENINKYDAVIGYRKKRMDSKTRIVFGWMWSRIIWIIFGINYRDIDCAFKLFTRTILNKINAEHIMSGGAMISAEILVKIKDAGGRVLEIPVTHMPRQFGRPTGINPKVIGRAFIELYKFWISYGVVR